MRQARSLRAGTMLIAYHKDRSKNEKAVAIVLKNDYASKYCTIHAWNFREQQVFKEWTKEFSYSEMKKIIQECDCIH